MQNLRKVAAMNGRKEEGERLTKEVGGMGGGREEQFSVSLVASRCAGTQQLPRTQPPSG